MKRALFIDRDGTIIIEPADEQIDSFEKLEFYPGAITALAKIAKETDFELVMVSNQDGLGTASFPEHTFRPVHNFIIKTLEGEGIRFKKLLIDNSFPHENSPKRKPGTGMLKGYMNGNYDLAGSYVIGDRKTDVQLAKNLGCKSIRLTTEKEKEADLVTTDWNKIYEYLKNPPRCAEVARKTRETDIHLKINLDGSGKYKIKSGLGFFDHMLELFTKHSGCDITLKVKGDLHVDEHHSVEDTALALGEAFKKAMGDKRGMERYGFVLPMDECLTLAALDFSGRPDLIWNVSFKREKVGDMPTELFKHFFKSFCDAAGLNLHITAQGENEHHKIEAVFKAVARSIKQALRRDPRDFSIPSSKGIL
ncbi:MAG: bifunctional histidinol-phosphatase/imidazoleglycerol-phosphate dehydratase HisB [Calditrichaceae bacterium]|nr:bifunctional histidinol-phosphatase/imidazoleglycerol-phosphate dehydratase HisB [Calditrichaceae bacterium]MBN2708870.1 bifunctional histidinol-phosphatase/imidazoleglycerol-phosphate dehydratase HisB [Calditrichaceae bacterium]RQV97604.1 MAG: bifunctional histidinol-phosphatase/imidazoleglycerol-phosphate dehydratase HisB [Calditrichota bacterium]